MLRSMTTHDIQGHDTQRDDDVWATGRFEPCVAFDGDDDGICATCGWLAVDHDHDADVVTLPQVVALAMRRAS
jgi:hypothetical protein